MADVLEDSRDKVMENLLVTEANGSAHQGTSGTSGVTQEFSLDHVCIFVNL